MFANRVKKFRPYRTKLKLMLPVFLGIVCCVAFIPLLIEYFVIRENLGKSMSLSMQVFLPLFIWVGLHLFWWRPKSENLIYENERARIFPTVTSAVTALCVAVFLFKYVDYARFPLVSLSSISEMSDYTNQKYFQFEELHPDDRWKSEYFTSETITGKYETLVYKGYCVIGLKEKENAKCINLPEIWIGQMFSKSFNLSAGNRPKERDWDIFKNVTKQKFSEYAFQNAHYFERMSRYQVIETYGIAIEDACGAFNPDMVVLIPHYSHFPHDFGKWLKYTLGTFVIGLALLLLQLIGPDVRRYEEVKSKTS